MEAASQQPIVVRYDDEVGGEFVADIVVDGTIIVERKSVRRLVLSHEIQLVNYLVATGKPVGLLLNFGETKVLYPVILSKRALLPSHMSSYF